MRRAILRLALGVVVVVLVSAVSSSAEVIQQILVKVNGEILTKTELEQRQVAVLRSRGIQPTDNAALEKALAEITPSLVFEAVNEMLLVQRGRELGYKMADEDFTRVVNRIREENKIESEEQFQAALRQEGMTMEDLRESLERQMLIARVQQNEVMGKMGITEEEALKYHAEHLDEFTTPGAVTIREILIAVPKDEKGVNVGLDDEAKEKAEAARQRILAGDAFEQVAADVSTSPSRANGGLIGPLDPAELSPELKELLGAMKPGDVSEVRRVPPGYQIIKLETMEPEKVLAPDEARDRIADALYEQKREVEVKKYLAKLRSQAIIEWKNDKLREAYEMALNEAGAGPATAPAEDQSPAPEQAESAGTSTPVP